MKKVPLKITGPELKMENLYDTLAEAMKLAGSMKDYDALEVYFPAVYQDGDGIGGKKPDDPLTIYITRHDGHGEYIQAWKISLTDVVEGLLDECAFNDGDIDAVRAVADGFETLAANIKETYSQS